MGAVLNDWRNDFLGWQHDLELQGRLTPALREACDELLANCAPDPAARFGVDRESGVPDLAYLRRYPIESRLTALKILKDIGVMDALRTNHPALHRRLVDELRGDAAFG